MIYAPIFTHFCSTLLRFSHYCPLLHTTAPHHPASLSQVHFTQKQPDNMPCFRSPPHLFLLLLWCHLCSPELLFHSSMFYSLQTSAPSCTLHLVCFYFCVFAMITFLVILTFYYIMYTTNSHIQVFTFPSFPFVSCAI